MISLSLLSVAVFAPAILHPLNAGWMWFGVSLGEDYESNNNGFFIFLIISPTPKHFGYVLGNPAAVSRVNTGSNPHVRAEDF